jgi:hypothetical protein
MMGVVSGHSRVEVRKLRTRRKRQRPGRLDQPRAPLGVLADQRRLAYNMLFTGRRLSLADGRGFATPHQRLAVQ